VYGNIEREDEIEPGSASSNLGNFNFLDPNSEASAPESSGDDNNFDDDDDNDDDGNPMLCESLAEWGIKFGISHCAVDGLLKILKPFHSELPLTARTLFETVKSSDITVVSGGEYCHFGLAEGLKQHIRCHGPPLGPTIQLQVNIDGLPLFKSSQVQVWPILCSVFNASFNKDPFVVGIFSGSDLSVWKNISESL